MSELSLLSVAETVAALRQRAVSPVEVVGALLERIEQLEPSLHAWQTLDANGALRAAEALEQRMLAGEPTGLLAGVAIGVKDLYDVTGLPTTVGSPLLESNVARADAAAAARLRAADAIILGKTVTTAFAYADPPPTRNPWNLAHTPGGSSSGSAAAVAARMVPGALGTQTAGSGLRPAAYCGVVGVKPTYGRVSRRGIWPLSWSMDTAAVHARSVADAVIILRAIAGPDPDDPTTLQLPGIDWADAGAAGRAPRIGLVREMVDLAEPEVREDVLAQAGRLAAVGAQVQEVRLPFANEDMIAIHHVVQQVEAAVCNQDLFRRHADGYPARFRAYLEVGESLPGTSYVEAQRVRRRMFQAVDALFGDLDALLLPTAAGTAPTADSTGSYVMLAAWTMLGLPAATLPSGLSRALLPLAVQLVGRFGQDAGLLRTAGWAEQVLGPLPAPEIRIAGAVG